MDMDDKTLRIQSLTREIREQLGEQNVLDALALELATQRVEALELRETLQRMSRDLDVMRATLRARDVLLPALKTDYALRRQVTLEATAPIPAGAGFHAIERDGKGTSFRWTGPTPWFQFELHLDRSAEALFTLHVPFWGRDRALNLRCTCDEQELPLVSEAGQRVLLLTGLLPVRDGLGLSTLRFHVDNLITPPVPEGREPRQLGVPVLRLSAKCAEAHELARWRAAAAAQKAAATKAPADTDKPAAAPAAQAADSSAS